MEELDLHPLWIYLAFVIGIGSAVIITFIGSHTIYHEQRDKIGSRSSRFVSILFFTAGWITCIAFACFRSDLILPMGTSIPCRFGFFLCTNGLYICKLLLLIIFLYRIHLAFGASALAYSTTFLISVSIVWAVIMTALNVSFMVVSWNVVALQVLRDDSTLHMCTSAGIGTDAEQQRVFIVVIILTFFDVFSSCFVCGLFVHKLRSVITMTRAETESHGARKFNMVLLARKQTTLVVAACITSILTLGLLPVTPGVNYCISLDIAANAICVWLMYSFNKKMWNGCIKYVCCCCYCCVYKEEVLVKLQSLRSTGSSGSIRSAASKPSAEPNETTKITLQIIVWKPVFQDRFTSPL
eukprot:72436_1